MAKKKMNGRKCVAYMRYSSDNQNDTSIEYQQAAIATYVKMKQMVLVKEFVDPAYTATNDNRPAFQEMIRESKCDPEWDTILVYDLSRFARNRTQADQYKADLRYNGFLVISVTEQCTEEDPGGFIESLQDLLNEEESKKIGRRTHAGMKNHASKGLHCGGVPPLGYDVVDNKLVINEYEAEIVKEIFDRIVMGESYRKIAAVLNDKGYKTKAGRPFTVNSFCDLLKQQKYVGQFVWNRRKGKKRNGKYNNHAEKPIEDQIIKENGCPAIIDKAVFDAVQEKMKARSEGRGNSTSKRTYMLGGLEILKCGECGRHMVGHVNYSHQKEYIVYRCPNHKAKQCSTANITAQNLNRFVAYILANRYFDKENLPALNDLLKGDLDDAKRRRDKNRRRAIESALVNLTKSLSKNYSETLVNEVIALEKEKKELEKSIDQSNLKSIQITPQNRVEIGKAILHKLRTSNDIVVRRFLKNVIKEIIVDNKGVSVKLAS